MLALLLNCVRCVEIEECSFIPFLHDARLNLGSCLALKPLVAVISDTPPKYYKYDPNICAQIITGLARSF